MSKDKITGSGSSSEVLGNATGKGLERYELQSIQTQKARHTIRNCSNATRWPARPGEQQYDWEEPRVVESCMGRAVNGASSRVDRLRLLGNGVVPQQAAKAWRVLNEES